MQLLNKVRVQVNNTVERIVYLAIFSLVIIVSAQVFWRYVLGNSLSWSEELARFLFIWITFLGAEITLRKKSHIAIDSLVKSLKGTPQLILSLLIDLIILGFAIIVLISGIALVESTLNQYSSALHIPIGYVYLAIPAAMVLMIINIIHSMQEKIRYKSIEGPAMNHSDELSVK